MYHACRYPVFSATCVEENVISLSYVLGAFVKNKMNIAALIHIQVCYSISLVFVSVFVPVPCCFCRDGSVYSNH
jgi:hypothetical protein